MVLLLAKQIITLYRAVQKTLTKDQHALVYAKKCTQKYWNQLVENSLYCVTDSLDCIPQFQRLFIDCRAGLAHRYTLFNFSLCLVNVTSQTDCHRLFIHL